MPPGLPLPSVRSPRPSFFSSSGVSETGNFSRNRSRCHNRHVEPLNKIPVPHSAERSKAQTTVEVKTGSVPHSAERSKAQTTVEVKTGSVPHSAERSKAQTTGGVKTGSVPRDTERGRSSLRSRRRVCSFPQDTERSYFASSETVAPQLLLSCLKYEVMSPLD